MCIFGMFQPQKKAAGFMPGDTADVDTDTTLVTGKDVKGIGDKADLSLSGKSTKKAAVDETGTATPTGAAALAINPDQSQGINV